MDINNLKPINMLKENLIGKVKDVTEIGIVHNAMDTIILIKRIVLNVDYQDQLNLAEAILTEEVVDRLQHQDVKTTTELITIVMQMDIPQSKQLLYHCVRVIGIVEHVNHTILHVTILVSDVVDLYTMGNVLVTMVLLVLDTNHLLKLIIIIKILI